MKRYWSISTTVRNAERIRNFLIALKELDGEIWNRDNQIRYQIILIQRRFYGLTNQFFNGLSDKQIDLLKSPDEIGFEQAEVIFNSKNYTDPAMRGRQSINPLKKMGLVNIVDQKVQITTVGEYFLQEDYDLGEMFFRSFLKWQVPNPDSDDFREEDGFCIKPFLGALHLIKAVNTKWESLGKEPKGISKNEFCLFVHTLIHYQSVDKQAQRVIDLRLSCEGKSDQEQKEIVIKFKTDFAKEILGNDVSNKDINRFLSNLKDYGDNAIRYFRLTRYLYIRGNGYYVDLEPRRHIEIDLLLNTDDASLIVFENREDYQNYMADINQPVLPWETDESLKQIAEDLVSYIKGYEADFERNDIEKPNVLYRSVETMLTEDLKNYIGELRNIRRKFQELYVHFDSQRTEKIESYIEQMENIYSFQGNKGMELERLSTLALNALNDALEISPNYPVGDDNEPTFTAPANKADIECFYETFNAVCEVTMLTNRTQWYNEGQPVMRHIRDFEDKHSAKDVYCLFIAPRLHQDTVETFWMAIRYGYRGTVQKIVPLSIAQTVNILRTLLSLKKQGKEFTHRELMTLYDSVIGITDNVDHSGDWISQIPETIKDWEENLLSKI